MAQFEKAGFAGRQVSLIREYAKYFDVEYYTSDVKDYSELLQVKHRPLPIRLDVPGLRHLLFWLYLVVRAPFMSGPIRTFGVEIPTLPIIRMLSRQKVIAGFQWDYASTTRTNYKGIKRWLANSIQGLGFAGADLVVCTADRLKAIAENKYGKKAAVIPNFVDFSLFKKSAQKDDFIFYAGRLHWAKGIDVLLAAFKDVSAACPGHRLLICGTGEMEGSLRKKVVEENIRNVEFMGSVQQEYLAGLMARAKVFVLPTTTSEGHPKALIEAMASGTACVATRVPGSRDIISDNVNGKLVEPGDAKALGKTIIDIINDVRLRSSLEACGSESAREFSLQKVMSKEAETIIRLAGLRHLVVRVGN